MEKISLEKLVKELAAITPFKQTTDVGDVVLIATDQPRLILYAMVTSIVRDQARRDEWWHIGLTFLAVPLQQAVWTLRTPQMTGQEIFTMGGEERFMKAVFFGADRSLPDRPGKAMTEPAGKAGLKRIK